MIYRQLSTYEMINDLMDDDYASYTYDQAEALVNYYEELSEDIDIEWDSVAIRCEWTTYDNIEEVKNNYSDLESLEQLEENTQVIVAEDNTLIVMDF
ncbi:MAG: hypothetical protein K0U20_09540 [Proteobacteria bacterium]|nr:hypothetical protein [Pseudomonadota bacterium]